MFQSLLAVLMHFLNRFLVTTALSRLLTPSQCADSSFLPEKNRFKRNNLYVQMPLLMHISAHIPSEKKSRLVSVASKHMDGTMVCPERIPSWLALNPREKAMNVVSLPMCRCLSEGVDVPSLDAVMFLSCPYSQVDVVNLSGRVMRKGPEKKYGYIIILSLFLQMLKPIKLLMIINGIKSVWTVLNALRAHDDRFNATVNKIERIKSGQSDFSRPDQISLKMAFPSPP